jgi:FkbM family methyltransferase
VASPALESTVLNREDVIEGYRRVLGREPESVEIVERTAAHFSNKWDFLNSLVISDEFRTKQGLVAAGSYAGIRDEDIALLRHYQRRSEGRLGYLTDFVGSITDVRFLGRIAGVGGGVEDLPLPGSFHAEAIEWVGVLRAVDEARDSFSVSEIGAGWGPWIVSAAVAARNKGIGRFHMSAVEADAGHVEMMRKHVGDNGFAQSDAFLLHAAIGSERGSAFFPNLEQGEDWGAAAVFGNLDAPPEVDYRGQRVQYTKVPVVTFEDALASSEYFDLVHVDVQGLERELVPSNLGLLTRKVRWLVIGTHSRSIEGDLIEVLGSGGWELRYEKPCRIQPTRGSLSPANTLTDGTQVWKNEHMLDR